MLSIIIITKNESEHISRCLESVLWADEIIILDSGSTDDTVAICKQYTPLVYQTNWPGFGVQKQRALDKAQGDWVLSIDADEYLSEALKVEIQQAIQQEAIQGFEIPRLSSYCGKSMKHGGWWPDRVLRLFQRSNGHFTAALVHEKIIITGKLGQLSEPLLHETYVNLEEVVSKVNTYSSLGAQELYKKGKTSSLSSAILRGLWTFIRTYIIKSAFLDGPQGLMLAISNAEAAYYKYLKLLEIQNNHKK
ncbi:glycosyltransferase family 2 protein [Methyloprofundus sp.]|uniref:glycosyltransferase family 2 protein n=1 Tax=Methyloprofundus sp. TaxID=2020875 RepID=UPI00261E204B|nr:glycosyltransferase family 2 protein [Methyloprofundus sp.]